MPARIRATEPGVQRTRDKFCAIRVAGLLQKGDAAFQRFVLSSFIENSDIISVCLALVPVRLESRSDGIHRPQPGTKTI
jgi:hypothetical protein